MIKEQGNRVRNCFISYNIPSVFVRNVCNCFVVLELSFLCGRFIYMFKDSHAKTE